jgi:dTDP-4-dehydrorhamnose reductase
MLRLGQEKEVVRVVADQYGCPTYAADLAETILAIVGKIIQGRQIAWGTYHYCGKGVTSWHGFAEKIFTLASEHTTLAVKMVEPITTEDYPTAAKRPPNSALDCSLLAAKFGITPLPWAASLAEMIKRVCSIG